MSVFATLFFAFVVILDSFIDGLAIGSFMNNDEITLIGIVLAVYKIPIAFATGVIFLSTGLYCCSFINLFFGFLYTLATPGGIIMMMYLEDN